MGVLADLRACPLTLVVEGTYETFMLDFALCRPWVDAQRVGESEFFQYPFGGEGGEDLLTYTEP